MKAGNRLIYGVAVNDVGDSCANKTPTKWYACWRCMLERCYDEKKLIVCPTYIGCSVCDDWLVASNFKDFYDKNYIKGYQLDKDILVDGNKVYSPETCRFIPRSLNTLFIDHGRARGEYPIGVYYNCQKKKFRAQLGINGKRKHLGYYETAEEAHEAYLIAKKAYCKEVADEHFVNGSITKEIRDAVYTKADNLK